MLDDSTGRLRVVIPVHNAGPYLRDALLSVLADLPPGGEVVVVDDGSTDDSTQICREFADANRQITLIRHESALGVSSALNSGIQHGRCPEFVAVHEHDDVVVTGRFATQLATLIAEPQLAAVASEGRYIGPRGRVFGRVASGPGNREEFERMRNNAEEILIPHPSVMFRTSAVMQCGLYRPEFDGAQDLELFNRMVYEFGWEVRCLPDKHVLYRLHDSATTFAVLSEQRKISRYIRYRNSCALHGRAAIPYGKWTSRDAPSPRAKLRWRRHDLGAASYRRAGLAWLEGRYFRAARLVSLAALTHPQWVLHKLLKLAGR